MESAAPSPPTTVPSIKVTGTPKFDIESYLANYTGKTRFDRLFLIGTCSTVLAVDALKAAVSEALSGNDVGRYEEAVQALRLHLVSSDPHAVLDRAWIDQKSKTTKAETDRLERELKGYKNNMIKESIRMGNEELGTHYHNIGDLASAAKAYTRMRDYCTTTANIASMCLRLIHVSIDRGDWLAVQSNVFKVRNLRPVKNEDWERLQSKVTAAMGLSQLETEAYRDAANSFLSVDPAITDTYNEVISSNDIAVYGGLCALASMDREELQRHVLDNQTFRSFLELEPHIRRAISFFCASKYTQCLEILEAYRTDYLLDLHLQQQVSNLYRRVRSKSIVQYLAPFSRVTLDSMSQAFATSLQRPIEDELIEMIESGTLQAKIDLENQVLVSGEKNLRTEVHQEAQDMMKAFTREAHLRLLRMNVLNAGLEVKAPGKQGGANHFGGAGDLFSGHGGRQLRAGGRQAAGGPF
ncbi:MAG: hypothetical protein Q9227_005342 [Pyrenula ochraceoflavens]